MKDDRCKMIAIKTIQFARLQATNKSAKNENITNLKELPRLHKLSQGASAESVEGGVKIGKTCLPLIGPLSLSKVLNNHLNDTVYPPLAKR